VSEPEEAGPDVFEGIPADPELTARGWVRRYLAGPERAREAMETYAAIGYEVLAQELTPTALGPRCLECAAGLCRTYVMIYTRRK